VAVAAAGLAVTFAGVAPVGAAGLPPPARRAPSSMRSSLKVGGNPDRVVVGPTGVWVGDLGQLARVDPQTEAVTDVPGATTPIAVGTDAVFAGVYTRPDTIGSVDPSGARVGTTVIVGGFPAGLAVDQGSVWVLDASGTLARLDAATGAVTGERALGSFGFAIAAGGGAVWVSGRTTDPAAGPLGSLYAPHTQPVLWRVDPTTLALVATIATGANCDRLDTSSGTTWASCGGTARKVDAARNRLVNVRADASNGIAVGDGAAWALSAYGTVVQLDAVTGRTLATRSVPPGSEGIAVGDGALWIANPHLHDAQTYRGTGSLLRVNLSS
jgi:hypothetical protein